MHQADEVTLRVFDPSDRRAVGHVNRLEDGLAAELFGLQERLAEVGDLDTYTTTVGARSLWLVSEGGGSRGLLEKGKCRRRDICRQGLDRPALA